MVRYLVRRLWQALIVIVAVAVAVFVVTRLVGDPISLILPLESTPEMRDAAASRLGLDLPIPVQLINYFSSIVHLDFGTSIWQNRPAVDIVFERIPATLSIAIPAMVLATVLGAIVGMSAALKPGGLWDRIAVTSSLIGLSIPQFWLALLLVMVFAVGLRWLPTSGIGGVNAILPIVALALPSMGRIVTYTRSNAMDELNRPYIESARSRGIPPARLLRDHVLRNVLASLVTLSAWETIATIAGYSIIVETVFGWPGVGLATMEAVQQGDIYLLQAIVLTVSILVVLINLVVDIAYRWIDPRVKFA